MNTNPSLKPALSLNEQIELLKKRDLIIQDPMYAKQILSQISYYRFTGYLLPFKTRQSTYKIGTTFEHIVQLYDFDSKLRAKLLKLCEYIEIQTRTHLSNFLAIKHANDPLCYKIENNFAFRNTNTFDDFIAKWDGNLNRSSEAFIKHHKQQYHGHFPIWVAIEVLTFSNLSIFYSNFKSDSKRQIANIYRSTTPHLLQNWLHVLSVLRNVCAHFSRIYYTFLDKTVALSHHANSLRIDPKKLFAIIFSSKYIVQNSLFWNEWVYELEHLMIEYRDIVDHQILGFIPNWKYHLLSTE